VASLLSSLEAGFYNGALGGRKKKKNKNLRRKGEREGKQTATSGFSPVFPVYPSWEGREGHGREKEGDEGTCS